VSFAHSLRQNKSFVIEASQALKCSHWAPISGALNSSRRDGMAS
jgi:hypothetical protein